MPILGVRRDRKNQDIELVFEGLQGTVVGVPYVLVVVGGAR